MFLFSQAGYLGTAVFGCLLIYLGQFEKLSKTIVGMIGITMVVASLSLVGFNIGRTGCQGFFSLIWGLAIGAFFLWAGVKWKPSTANLLLLFVAIQTALNSLTSIMALFQGGLIGLGPWSDATNMQAMTGIPAVVWSLLWIAISVGMVALTLKYTYFRGLIKSDS